MNKSEAGKLGGKAWAEKAKLIKQEKIRTYEISPSCCEYCKQPLPYDMRKNRFCCQRCSGLFYAAENFQKCFCLNCGNEITGENRAIRTYCSHKCQRDYQFTQETLPKIENGLVSERKTLKNYLRKIRGNCCEKCGISDWHGQPLSLELDHVNGDASNNKPENIRLLCPNCHSLMPTSKGKNRGNGRKSRGLRIH
jgi:hypothetical protein